MSEVAAAFVTIVPSARGFGRKLESEVGPEVSRAGKSVGSKFGGGFKVGATAAAVPSAPLFRVGPEELA